MAELIDIVFPADQQEGTESIVSAWFKKPGDSITKNAPILEISTDKVTVEIAAPATGVLKEVLKNENDSIEPGDLLGQIELSAGESSFSEEKQVEEVPVQQQKTSDSTQLSPAVRRLIKQHGIDASLITGTGKEGRITHKDVEDYIASSGGGSKSEGVTGEKIPHTPMRRTIAKHMVSSALQTAPHVTAVFDADLSAVMAHREEVKAEYADRGVRLTYTAYFVAAAVEAIKAVPQVNSRWHDDALEVFEQCNIGVATALEQGGLIVPVLEDAQSLDLFEIAKRVQDLTTRARADKLEQHEVHNGTFTITNHGGSGSLIATPIILQPQSAILGVGKVEKRAVVINDSVEIKPMLYVTLTIDHRVLDGYQANQFLTAFVKALRDH